MDASTLDGTQARQHADSQALPTIADLPEELFRSILSQIDGETLAVSVPLVCKAWRDASRQPAVWHGLLSDQLLGQLETLAEMGPAVSPAHLFLALRGRNLLRNPGFRKEDNSSLLPPLLPGAPSKPGSWGQWLTAQRTAWVLNTSVGAREVGWEPVPQGMAPEGEGGDAAGPAAHGPPAPLPYPGAAPLASYMRRAFRGLLQFVKHAAAASEEPPRSATSPGRLAQPTEPSQQPSGPAARGAGGPRGLVSGPQDEGAQEPERQEGQVGCLASLDHWSELTQLVDLVWELQRRGLTAAQAAHLLDAGLSLRFSVHVGSRHDSEGEYAVAVLLDEGASTAGSGAGGGGSGRDGAMPSLQSFVMRPGRHLGFREVERMRRGVWERFEYRVPGCPRGFRRAAVMLRGRRAPVGAGGEGGEGGEGLRPGSRFCGAKFASAELVFE